MEFLRRIDTFGVQFNPAIDANKNFSYKTHIGGICSILLYSLSAAYFVYEMYRWMNMGMIPVVTTELHSFDSDIENLLDESNASIEFQIYNTAIGSSHINPFNQSQLVLTPILKNFSNGKESSVGYNFSEYVEHETFSPILRLNSKSEYQISFARCVQENLIDGQICADAETMDKFFEQKGNELQVNVILKIIDPKTFEEKKIKKTYGIVLEEIECQMTKVNMVYTNYEIYQGFIFPRANNKIYVSETVEQTTYGTKDYCSKRFVEESFALLWIATSNVAYLQRMQYPEIGDVLANIGSIVQILFLVEYFIQKYNDSSLTNQMTEQILSFYYPEIKNFRNKKNFYGGISQSSYSTINVNPRSVENLKLKLKTMINCKFSYLNIIYEISRLQFLMQSILSKEDIIKSHRIGIKLNFQQTQTNENLYDIKFDDLSDELLNSAKIQNSSKLQFNDSMLLSLNNRQLLLQEPFVETELVQERDFFEINRVQNIIM